MKVWQSSIPAHPPHPAPCSSPVCVVPFLCYSSWIIIVVLAFWLRFLGIRVRHSGSIIVMPVWCHSGYIHVELLGDSTTRGGGGPGPFFDELVLSIPNITNRALQGVVYVYGTLLRRERAPPCTDGPPGCPMWRVGCAFVGGCTHLRLMRAEGELQISLGFWVSEIPVKGTSNHSRRPDPQFTPSMQHRCVPEAWQHASALWFSTPSF